MTLLDTWATDDPEYRLIRTADEDRIREALARMIRRPRGLKLKALADEWDDGMKTGTTRERTRIRAGATDLMALIAHGRYEQMDGPHAAVAALDDLLRVIDGGEA